MTRTTADYGTWRSPITSELLVHQAVGLSQVEIHGDRVLWNELRASEGGRQVVVAAGPDGATAELLPDGFSARTQVHEYGGRCWTLAGDALIASNWTDQRLWRFAPGAEPEPLTAEPAMPRADRYADPVITPDLRWLVCVRERHHAAPDGTPARVDNSIVAVPLEGGGEPVVLVEGRDFYSAPRLSPDGQHLAWISWDHPNMPWDHTELWVAPLGAGPALGPATLVAGDAGDSVLQPRWSPAGVLHYISDRSGWWNLYSAAPGRALCPIEAEMSEPGWVFGVSTYGFLADGTIVATWSGPAGTGIGRIVDGTPRPLETRFDAFTSLQAAGSAVACIAGSATEAAAVVRIEGDDVTVLRRSRDATVDPGFLARPERVSFPTGEGEVAYALVYPPTNADYDAPEGSLPPLVVMSHGGPTSSASAVLNLGVQYFTSRGFAVADVDYRGSTGYGRAYRQRLRGTWGLVDVEDCANVARWLAAEGRVDPARAVIRGGSAGGFTTLAALAFTDTFAAGANHFGVADLELLARDTHKFESRYLDGLVGPWPEAADTYTARSPIHHVDGFDCPLIIFQGLEDMVVPPAQSEMIHEALRARGIPVAYLAFEGEQHGFRRAETIRAVADAELSFYGRVLGFVPDGAVDVPIDNAETLPAH